jgi:glycosyltransferase involved in cell wall biosynthesis
MKKVIVYTQAYNAENTIRRTIDSVLNQTHGNFKYYILDNASTDKTGDIIREYASRDNRIVPFYFEQNIISFKINISRLNLFGSEDFDYFAHLDADDEYLPCFLEKSLSFAEQHNCETVCVGSCNIDAESGAERGGFKIDRDFILTSENFDTHYYYYQQFNSTLWGKIISKDVVLRIDTSSFSLIANAEDTLFGVNAFRHSTRIGIMSDVLHRYYLSKKGYRNVWNYKRSRTSEILDTAFRTLAISKCGYISRQMEEWIIDLYLCNLRDTINVLNNSDADNAEKILALSQMLINTSAKEYGLYKDFGISFGYEKEWGAGRRSIFSNVMNFLLGLKEVPKTIINNYCDIGELCAEVIEKENSYLLFRKIRLQNYCLTGKLEKAEEVLKELTAKLPGDSFLEPYMFLLD